MNGMSPASFTATTSSMMSMMFMGRPSDATTSILLGETETRSSLSSIEYDNDSDKDYYDDENDEYDNDNDDLWSDLLVRFQGDFDNYHQVLDDRQKGKLPREGGGHEHIHCTLIPLTESTRLAAFYFDGQPGVIFRLRFYQLVPKKQPDGTTVVETILYTLHPALEALLRQSPHGIMAWPHIFEAFQPPVNTQKVYILPQCEVQWSRTLDTVHHAYVPRDKRQDSTGIHAVMVHGQAIVDSQMMPGARILIKDELSMWPNELWINDRGHDPVTMKFIYGNQHGEPYKLERVSHIIATAAAPAHAHPKNNNNNNHNKEEQQQQVASVSRMVLQDSPLAWTLGPEHRTEEAYQAKIDAVGGPSYSRNHANRGGNTSNQKKNEQ